MTSALLWFSTLCVYFKNDIRDFDALYKISAGVDVIFHTASYGMSGPEQVTEIHICFITALV